MAKHGNKFYLELPRKIFTDEYKSLSTNAKWLYAVLNELEHRFSDGKADGSFFQSDRDLSEASGIKLTALKAAKKELVERGLVETRQGHFEEEGKRRNKPYFRGKKAAAASISAPGNSQRHATNKSCIPTSISKAKIRPLSKAVFRPVYLRI